MAPTEPNPFESKRAFHHLVTIVIRNRASLISEQPCWLSKQGLGRLHDTGCPCDKCYLHLVPGACALSVPPPLPANLVVRRKHKGREKRKFNLAQGPPLLFLSLPLPIAYPTEKKIIFSLAVVVTFLSVFFFIFLFWLRALSAVAGPDETADNSWLAFPLRSPGLRVV